MADEIILLNRIRGDIGEVSGPMDDLLQYASFKGFNDNYEPQEKPRLVGTWTITGWYTVEQLSQAQSTFDGLTIIADPNYIIDFSQYAVQTIDPEQPNYNPAVAIILKNHNIQTLQITSLGTFITKSDFASAIPDRCSWFSKVSVVNGGEFIPGNYPLNDLRCLKYATNFVTIENNSRSNSDNNNTFLNCSELEYIDLSNITQCIQSGAAASEGFYDGHHGAFRNCTKLKEIVANNCIFFNGPENFSYCSSLERIVMNSLQEVGYSKSYSSSLSGYKSFGDGLTSLTYAEFNSMIAIRDNMCAGMTALLSFDAPVATSIGTNSFYNCTALQYIRFGVFCEPVSTSIFGSNNTCKIYVGAGELKADDDALLTQFQSNAIWATFGARLDTWYNYLHPSE